MLPQILYIIAKYSQFNELLISEYKNHLRCFSDHSITIMSADFNFRYLDNIEYLFIGVYNDDKLVGPIPKRYIYSNMHLKI